MTTNSYFCSVLNHLLLSHHCVDAGPEFLLYELNDYKRYCTGSAIQDQLSYASFSLPRLFTVGKVLAIALLHAHALLWNVKGLQRGSCTWIIVENQGQSIYWHKFLRKKANIFLLTCVLCILSWFGYLPTHQKQRFAVLNTSFCLTNCSNTK